MKSTGVLFALCCVLLAPALGQYLESVIMLPDTLGPLTGPYCLAWDDNPAHPRLYVGGQSYTGGVVVAEAITCKRLARIPTGPVAALCFVPTHNKLYVAKASCDTIAVVDCATNQIVSMISVAGEAPALQYNLANDRLYCGGSSMSVVDCAADTAIHTIALTATFFALDSIDNRLYAGCGGPLSVIDCATDSVVATVPGIDAVAALCFNPTAGKVYAVSDDTLYAIRTDGDSIVARLTFAGLGPVLTCDPQRNRIYCAYSGGWASIDCAGDTVLQRRYVTYPPHFLACNVARDRLYCFRSYWDGLIVYDATGGGHLSDVMLDGIPVGGGWSPGLDRLYCLPSQWNCLLSAVDGTGDSIAGVVPLRMKAEDITLDTVRNRLYFAYASSASGCIGAVDCSQHVVTSYVYAGGNPMAMCYNPNNGRLYWRSGGSLIVYDCSTNTVIRKMEMGGGVQKARLHLGLNKLYAECFESTGVSILVIDCRYDSVVKRIAVPSGSQILLLVPEDDMLWSLCVNHVVAIDCLGDSIVADALAPLGSIDDACVCLEGRKIYAGWFGRPAWIVDMDDPAHVDTLHPTIPDVGMRFLNIPGAHKVYWGVSYSGHPPGNSRVFVIDTRTSTITDSFWTGRQMSGMCLDHTGRYVYCTGYEDDVLLVLDTQTDSVVTMFDLPSSTFGPPLPNRATNRVYPSSSDNPIPVVRDSMLIGLEELVSTERRPCVSPTLVGRAVPFRATAPAELYDASGRKVAALRPGPNDISHLAPGVYFLRGPKTEDRRPDAAIRKVVVTR